MGGGRGDGVEDESNGADDIELDDGAPEDALLAKGCGGVEALKLCGGGAGVGRRWGWGERMTHV